MVTGGKLRSKVNFVVVIACVRFRMSERYLHNAHIGIGLLHVFAVIQRKLSFEAFAKFNVLRIARVTDTYGNAVHTAWTVTQCNVGVDGNILHQFVVELAQNVHFAVLVIGVQNVNC